MQFAQILRPNLVLFNGSASRRLPLQGWADACLTRDKVPTVTASSPSCASCMLGGGIMVSMRCWGRASEIARRKNNSLRVLKMNDVGETKGKVGGGGV